MSSDRRKLRRIAGPDDLAQAYSVSRETMDRLRVYAETLLLWQPRINLVGRGTLDDIWQRHFADSLQLLPLAPVGPLHWCDLGSGAGFPGLVAGIALAERPGSRLTLIESDARKCAFLGEVVRKTAIAPGMPVDILNQRIEVATTRDNLGGVNVVSARALAPLDRLLALAAPLFGAETVGLFPKGKGVDDELKAAELSLSFAVDRVASETEAGACVLVVRQPRARTEG